MHKLCTDESLQFFIKDVYRHRTAGISIENFVRKQFSRLVGFYFIKS